LKGVLNFFLREGGLEGGGFEPEGPAPSIAKYTGFKFPNSIENNNQIFDIQH
jgi:hypothetical protein